MNTASKTSLTDDGIDLVLSGALSARELVDAIDCSLPTIYRVARQYGVTLPSRRRKYSVNEQFFQTWNEEMAYVLGFIAADGCVVNNKRVGAFIIGLNAKDRHILETIKATIGYEGPIYDRPAKPGAGAQVILHITSRLMATDLNDLGMTQHKSSELQWSDAVPSEFLSHFVRGYFDGDGSVFTTQAHNPNDCGLGCNLVGTEHFMRGLKAAFDQLIGKPCGHVHDHVTWFSLTYNGNALAASFLDWIYQDSTQELRLSRKWDLYQQFLDSREQSDVPLCDSLTYALAQQIREDHRTRGLNQNELSRKYNVNRASIGAVLADDTWVKPDGRDARSSLYFTAWGETKHWKDWLDDPRCVVGEATLFDRLVKREAPPEEAMTTAADRGVTRWGGDRRYGTPTGKQTRILTGHGETKSLLQWSLDARCEVPYPTLYHRVARLNVPLESALLHDLALPSPEAPSAANGKTANHSRINWEIAAAMRAQFQAGATVKVIAAEFAQSEALVYDVVQNRSWTDTAYISVRKRGEVQVFEHEGRTGTLTQWAVWSGVPKTTIDRRIREGRTFAQSITPGRAVTRAGDSLSLYE